MVERDKEVLDDEEVPDARLWRGGRGGGGNHNRDHDQNFLMGVFLHKLLR